MKNYKMKNVYFWIKGVSLLILMTGVTSCNGQDKKQTPSHHTEITSQTLSNTDTIEHSVFDQYLHTDASKDTLFYIDGQLCQHLRSIFQDRKGNLWFGTNVYDIMRYNGEKLEYFSEENGVNGGRITGIIEDENGVVWFSSYNGLIKYDGNTFTSVDIPDEKVNKESWCLFKDSKGEFWMGTTEGVIRYNGEKFSSFPIPRAAVKDPTTLYSFDRVTSILEDKNGVFWFGTDGHGITKFDGTSFSHITKEDGLPDNNIGGFMQDSKGNIWISTSFGGVTLYDGETFTNFTKDGIIDGVEVGAFFEDSNGDVWFAAENHGVYRYDGTSFKNYNEKDGLNTNGVLSIFRDAQGRFWFGGWGGLFRFDGHKFVSVTRYGPWE